MMRRSSAHGGTLNLYFCFLAACRAHLALWGGFLRSPEAIPASMREDVRDLVEAFREEIGGAQLIPTLTRVSALLDQAAITLRWNDGLRETIVALVTRSVDAAEQQFGPKTGAFKRDFVIDVVLRVLSRDYLDIPLPGVVETALKPVVGAFVDWTVEVFNTNRGRAWYAAPETTRLPRRYGGFALETQWRVYRTLLRLWVWLSGLFLAVSSYERQLRRVAASLAPHARTMQQLLPVESLSDVAQKLGNILVHLGELTRPHIRTIERLVRFAKSERFNLTDAAGRRKLLVAVLQELLGEVYDEHPFILSLIRSDLGAFLLGEVVSGIELILDKSGMLPRAERPLEQRLLGA